MVLERVENSPSYGSGEGEREQREADWMERAERRRERVVRRRKVVPVTKRWAGVYLMVDFVGGSQDWVSFSVGSWGSGAGVWGGVVDVGAGA